MPGEQEQWFDLIKHNLRNPDPATTKVVDTVRGRGFAERAVEVLDDRLTAEDREAGFSHFLQKGKRPPGVDLRKRRMPANPKRIRR